MEYRNLDGHFGDEIAIGDVVLINNGDLIEVKNKDKTAFAPFKAAELASTTAPARKDYADTEIAAGNFLFFKPIFYSIPGRWGVTTTTYEEIAKVPFLYSKLYSLLSSYTASFHYEFFESHSGSVALVMKLEATPIGGGSPITIIEVSVTGASTAYEEGSTTITTELGSLDSGTDYDLSFQIKQSTTGAGNHGVRSASILFRR